MRERPIRLKAHEVRAILSGAKTQTRPAITPQPSTDASGNFCWKGINFGQDTAGRPLSQTLASQLPCSRTGRVHCPFGKIGDRLWVRETWMPGYYHEADHEDGPKVSLIYAADNAESAVAAPSYELAEKWEREFCEDGDEPPPWRPSIHMPRWACRLVLEITAVRVERLQAISEADALAEGAMEWAGEQSTPIRDLNAGDERIAFKALWESTGGDWDADPWMWVIGFKQVTP
ncbi:hypothetical protein [Xanthomonas axonopodis]